MSSKGIPQNTEPSPATYALLSRDDLAAELAALRKESRSKQTDAAKAEIKKHLKAHKATGK